MSFRGGARPLRNLLFPFLREKRYYVYIMASKSRVLYIGMTGFLMARVLQHKLGETGGFTQKHRATRLVYFETFKYVNNAITRETEMKKWRREKKIALIVKENPTWEDLAKDWGTPMAGAQQIPHLLKQVRNDKGLE